LRFYRTKEGTEIRNNGKGLGLTITKHIIELHHGKIEVESVQEKGSTFRIFLLHK